MRKFIKGFFYAGRGIYTAFSSELNMKVHGVAAICVVICGLALKITAIEWIICIICIGLVLAMEMINTAIEKVVDLTSPMENSLAGKAKDIAAGAVLTCSIFAAIVGGIIFIPKIMKIIIQISVGY